VLIIYCANTNCFLVVRGLRGGFKFNFVFKIIFCIIFGLYVSCIVIMGSQHRWPFWLFCQPAISTFACGNKVLFSVLFCTVLEMGKEPNSNEETEPIFLKNRRELTTCLKRPSATLASTEYRARYCFTNSVRLSMFVNAIALPALMHCTFSHFCRLGWDISRNAPQRGGALNSRENFAILNRNRCLSQKPSQLFFL